MSDDVLVMWVMGAFGVACVLYAVVGIYLVGGLHVLWQLDPAAVERSGHREWKMWFAIVFTLCIAGAFFAVAILKGRSP